ncbi:MAG: hypothetical protein MH204_06920 [Fimbriimonadaceae bacterium]|nr:hypothetical protein [Fimbriimonadaceae bacterium]
MTTLFMGLFLAASPSVQEPAPYLNLVLVGGASVREGRLPLPLSALTFSAGYTLQHVRDFYRPLGAEVIPVDRTNTLVIVAADDPETLRIKNEDTEFEALISAGGRLEPQSATPAMARRILRMTEAGDGWSQPVLHIAQMVEVSAPGLRAATTLGRPLPEVFSQAAKTPLKREDWTPRQSGPAERSTLQPGGVSDDSWAVRVVSSRRNAGELLVSATEAYSARLAQFEAERLLRWKRLMDILSPNKNGYRSLPPTGTFRELPADLQAKLLESARQGLQADGRNPDAVDLQSILEGARFRVTFHAQVVAVRSGQNPAAASSDIGWLTP